MSESKTISRNTLGLIIGLVISVWWIFMGLDIGFRFEAPDRISYLLTLCGQRHTIMTIAALILIPICALELRWGVVLAMLLGSITLVLTVSHILYMVFSKPPGFESQLFGPIVWVIMQVPIIFFSYRAVKS
jgi:hypothetical protein